MSRIDTHRADEKSRKMSIFICGNPLVASLSSASPTCKKCLERIIKQSTAPSADMFDFNDFFGGKK